MCVIYHSIQPLFILRIYWFIYKNVGTSGFLILLVLQYTDYIYKLVTHTKRFIHENASENVVCENGGHLSRGRWINRTEYMKTMYMQCSLPMHNDVADDVAVDRTAVVVKVMLVVIIADGIYVVYKPCVHILGTRFSTLTPIDAYIITVTS